EQQKAFEELKRCFTSSPVLKYPDPSFPLRLETDASAFAIGAALIVKRDGDWHPATYMSHALSGAELNWSVYDKELYAIVKAFESWRHWLLPAVHEVEVWCDHLNLAYFRKPQVLTAKQSRWYTTLQQYNYHTVH